MWELSLARFVIGVVFLSAAAIKDFRTREVENELWITMGIIGMIILAVELVLVRKARWEFLLIFIPIGVIFSEAFIDRPPVISNDGFNPLVFGWLILPLIVFIYMASVLSDRLLFWSLTMILAVMLLAFLFYFLYILHGGADAKAVITLAILLPFYPELPGFTLTWISAEMFPIMEVFFPFTLIVLLNSSLLILIFPLSSFFFNLFKGDIDIPKMFFGYKKRVKDLEDSFVWPMQYYENGKIKTELFPRSGTDEKFESLKDHDVEEVWATPKIPFMVPMVFGFVLSFIIGNPVMYVL
ncbi:MAG: A24 family peptidase C-terminal domain-containing protein [Candidatus Natronoplasma sp.]